MNPLATLAGLLTTGAAAGFFSGLMGVGGGFVMVPAQYWLLTGTGISQTVAIRIAFGTSLAVALLGAISSTWGHHQRNAVIWDVALPMGIAALLGGLVGGTLAAFAPGTVLKGIFAAIVILAGVRMLISLPEPAGEPGHGTLPLYLITGAGIGIISGLAGIAGGIVLVPILIFVMGFPVHRAVGTSSACLIFSTTGGVCAYVVNGLSVSGLPPYSLGYVNLVQWAVLAATMIPCTQIGVLAAHRLCAAHLCRVFGMVMIGIGVLMIV